MDLSHAFIWRGAARYWDVPVTRRQSSVPRAKKNRKLHVRAETYELLVKIARRRGIAIQAVVDIVLADLP